MHAKTHPNTPKMPAKSNLLKTPQKDGKSNLVNSQNAERTRSEKTSHEETKAGANLQARKISSAAEFYRDNGSKRIVRKEVFHTDDISSSESRPFSAEHHHKENVNTQEEPCSSSFGKLDEGHSVLVRDCTQGMEKSNTTTCPDVKLGSLCESFYFVDPTATGTEWEYKSCRFTKDNKCMWLGDTCNHIMMKTALAQVESASEDD